MKYLHINNGFFSPSLFNAGIPYVIYFCSVLNLRLFAKNRSVGDLVCLSVLSAFHKTTEGPKRIVIFETIGQTDQNDEEI